MGYALLCILFFSFSVVYGFRQPVERQVEGGGRLVAWNLGLWACFYYPKEVYNVFFCFMYVFVSNSIFVLIVGLWSLIIILESK